MTQASEQILSTLEADGSRRRMEPRLSPGRFWRRRAVVAWSLMALFFALPFLQINGQPAVLLDVPARRFHILGYTFLPTDTILLAFFMLGIFVSIFLFTALLGRLWCGWGCPQTVYLEFLYRPLERLFYGTIGRGGEPKRSVGGVRKTAYFFTAVLASLIPAHTFLAYFVGVEKLRHWMVSSPFQHPAAFVIMLATTFLMLFDFYFFREQLCILACPYGRFQSVLLDAYSLIVSYDRKRGEPRGKRSAELKVLSAESSRTQSSVLSPQHSVGDCVDCGLCVITCPTGIDIRNGLQMECVNCTQCIDACDSVMERLKRPRGLIRYSSQAAIERGERKFWRPRVILYPLLLAIIVGAFLAVFLNKGAADVLVTRTAGNPFTRLSSGAIANSVRVKITNRSDADAVYTISVVGSDQAWISISENPLRVAAGESRQEPFVVEANASLLKGGKAFVTLRVSDGRDFVKDTPVCLLGPGGSFGGAP